VGKAENREHPQRAFHRLVDDRRRLALDFEDQRYILQGEGLAIGVAQFPRQVEQAGRFDRCRRDLHPHHRRSARGKNRAGDGAVDIPSNPGPYLFDEPGFVLLALVWHSVVVQKRGQVQEAFVFQVARAEAHFVVGQLIAVGVEKAGVPMIGVPVVGNGELQEHGSCGRTAPDITSNPSGEHTCSVC
jgi:hypothetical protein